MKYKVYPTFKRFALEKKFDKFPKKEKEIINNFLKYVSITSSSSKRIANNKRSLIHLRVVTDKPLDNITLEDLRGFLGLLNNSNLTQSSQTEMKASIKRFLRWRYKDWSERFDELRDIKLKFGFNEKKINSSVLLKKEEIEDLIDKETRLIWKAFFLTLYESGLRPVELRTIKWDDITFDVEKKGVSSLQIYATKTSKSRTTFVQGATFYLKKLKKVRDTETPYVFPSPKDKTKPFSKDLVSHTLTRLCKKSIGRVVIPYIFRHTRAKELYLNPEIADSVVQKIMGHSQDMRGTYTRLDDEDVKEAMVKSVYDFEDLPPEKKIEFEERIKKLEDDRTELKNMVRKMVTDLLGKR